MLPPLADLIICSFADELKYFDYIVPSVFYLFILKKSCVEFGEYLDLCVLVCYQSWRIFSQFSVECDIFSSFFWNSSCTCVRPFEYVSHVSHTFFQFSSLVWIFHFFFIEQFPNSPILYSIVFSLIFNYPMKF